MIGRRWYEDPFGSLVATLSNRIARWLKRMLYIRVGFQIGGLTYVVVVHRLGLQDPRLDVVVNLSKTAIQKAPEGEVWRWN